MADKSFKDFVKSAENAYRNIAILKIESGCLVIRNLATNCIHPFVDGRDKIPLSNEQKKIVNQILKQ